MLKNEKYANRNKHQKPKNRSISAQKPKNQSKK